jgi:hypothetical protein
MSSSAALASAAGVEAAAEPAEQVDELPVRYTSVSAP